jgi:hypothetical protein
MWASKLWLSLVELYHGSSSPSGPRNFPCVVSRVAFSVCYSFLSSCAVGAKLYIPIVTDPGKLYLLEGLMMLSLDPGISYLRVQLWPSLSLPDYSSISTRTIFVCTCTHPGCWAHITTCCCSRDSHLTKKLPSALLAPYAAAGSILSIVVKLPPILDMYINFPLAAFFDLRNNGSTALNNSS